MHLDNKKQVEILTGVDVIATVKHNDKDIKISRDALLKLFK